MSRDGDLLARRFRLLGEGAPLFYDQPVHIVRGEGAWMWDADGRRFLDVYNNVPHVGHCHPRVVEAICRQAATLNVHTRYLHETVIDYGERLTASMDGGLDTVVFVNSGSEANDLALRMARLWTGGTGIICTDATYHGNTAAVDELATLFHGGRGLGPHVRAVPYADRYRPLAGPGDEALVEACAGRVREAIGEFRHAGTGLAGILLCPILANEGLPDFPAGYMQQAVALVREAGGLFIADEVQSGFGRTGRMWGYETSGVVPDIITLGKPMGNGHPIAATITRREILERFRAENMYFSTFGGNPVSCAAGMAVLDVIEDEKLVENAGRTGAFLVKGLRGLQARHDLIGDVRGRGLFLAAELVRDRASREPAAAETRRVVNLMKDRGVLLSKIGIHDNILKMRPPVCFGRDHAELLLQTLDEVLASL